MRAQDGDSRALASLVEVWQPRLMAHAIALLRDEEAARDAVQEAWFAALRGLPRLRDPAQFSAWIYRITTNKCTDFIRKARVDRAAAENFAEEQSMVVEPTLPTEGTDEITLLREALRRLPPARRQILTMFYLRDMSVSEIAVALAIPPGTVKSRLFHARDEVRIIMNRLGHSAT